MLKALFFDLDGTLIDSMDAHVKSWQESLREYNLFPSRNDLMQLGGVPFRETIKIVSKEKGFF